MMNELLEVADALELKGLSRIRNNSAMDKFLYIESDSKKYEDNNDSSHLAHDSGISRQPAHVSLQHQPPQQPQQQQQLQQQHVQIDNQQQQQQQTSSSVATSCTASLLFEDPPNPADEVVVSPTRMPSTGPHDIDISSNNDTQQQHQQQQSHQFSGLTRTSEATAPPTLQEQGFLACSNINNNSEVSMGNSSIEINNSLQTHNGGSSYVTGLCFNQATMSPYHSRIASVTNMQQQQQQQQQQHQQQHHQQHQQQLFSQPSQLYNVAALSSCNAKRDFDARMLPRTSMLEYQHPLEDYRLHNHKMHLALNNNNNNNNSHVVKTSLDVSQDLYHHHSVAADQLDNITQSAAEQQQCLQQSGSQQQQLRHHYPQYLQGSGQVTYTSNTGNNTGTQHLLSTMQQQQHPHQQQQQESSSTVATFNEFSCANVEDDNNNNNNNSNSNNATVTTTSTTTTTTTTLGGNSGERFGGATVGGGDSGDTAEEGDDVLTSLRSVASNACYQTAGIDLSLTKSEPSSPRDYTASSSGGGVSTGSKRKRVSGVRIGLGRVE